MVQLLSGACEEEVLLVLRTHHLPSEALLYLGAHLPVEEFGDLLLDFEGNLIDDAIGGGEARIGDCAAQAHGLQGKERGSVQAAFATLTLHFLSRAHAKTLSTHLSALGQ